MYTRFNAYDLVLLVVCIPSEYVPDMDNHTCRNMYDMNNSIFCLHTQSKSCQHTTLQNLDNLQKNTEVKGTVAVSSEFGIFNLICLRSETSDHSNISTLLKTRHSTKSGKSSR